MGTLRLFHRTSWDAAAAIMGSRRFTSKESGAAGGAEVCFSTVRNGQAVGYGEAVIVVEIGEEFARLDDEFPDGEQHYRVYARDIQPSHIVACALPD